MKHWIIRIIRIAEENKAKVTCLNCKRGYDWLPTCQCPACESQHLLIT